LTGIDNYPEITSNNSGFLISQGCLSERVDNSNSKFPSHRIAERIL
jgi:hypothetical protein